MKTVIVDRKNVELAVKRSGIVVDDQHIPYRLIDILVLASDTRLSSQVLLAITKERIPILVINRTNSHFCLTLPLEAKNTELKMAQYASVASSRLGFAKYFLAEKIRSHAVHLRTMGVSVDTETWVKKVEDAQAVEELLGIEGGFSRLYFRHYFTFFPKNLHKGKRSKRPPEDPVNAVLSYLYSWFYHLLTARLYLFGLDASLSYLHEPFRSHNGLSSDLLELFRADINRLALGWFDDELLKDVDFTRKNGVWIRYESRKRLWSELKEFGRDLMPRIDDEIALLRAAIT